MTNGNKAKSVNSTERAAELAKADRKLARKAIKKMDFLTRTQRDLLGELVDHWLAWRYRTGAICPGRAKLAKQCQCTPGTVSVALARFRELGFIEVHKFPRGGLHRATHYVVHLDVIICHRAAPEADGKLQPVQPAQRMTVDEEKDVTNDTERESAAVAETRGGDNRSDIRRARAAVKKMDSLTRTQRDLLNKIIDYWVAWRHRTGVISPGREKLAQQCLCSKGAVRMALARFRELGFIEARDFSKGGRGRSTHYVVHLDAIERHRSSS